MKKINFTHFGVADITGKAQDVIDIRKQLADVVYYRANGIAAHALAHKIYETDGKIELTKLEEQLLINIINEFCIPAIIDGVMKQLNQEEACGK